MQLNIRPKATLRIDQLTLCSVFTALTAAGAFIKIPTPLLPLTLQTMFVILSGLLLGPVLGLFSQLAYVLIGLFGIPIFTKGGGPQYILEPSFGYLLGFIAASFLIGLLTKRIKNKSFLHLFLISVFGILIIYLFGIPYMYLILNHILLIPTGFKSVITAGALLCAPGDLISCALAVLLSMKLLPILQKKR